MLPVQRNRSIWQHGTDQRHAGTGGSNGAVAQLVARFVRIEEVAVSTTVSSTKARCIHSTAAGFLIFILRGVFSGPLPVADALVR